MAKPSEQPKLLPVPPAPDVRDVRARRPYFLTRRLIASGIRRTVSTLALLAIDIAGISLAVYLALVVKELYLGHSPIQWGILWESQVEWLPFLTLVTVLVFWRSGLYTSRETRPGLSRVLSSLAVVALVTFVFGKATGEDFTTGSIFIVSFLFASTTVGLLRWSYDSVTSEILRSVGARWRTVLLGSGRRTPSLQRSLSRDDSGIRREFVAVLDDLEGVARTVREQEIDEILVEASGVDEQGLIELLDLAQRRGIKVRIAPTMIELLTHRAAYLPGKAVPLFELRPPVFAGTDWALKRGFDLVVSAIIVIVGLPLWLAIAAAVKLSSPGPVFYRDPRVGVGEEEFRMFKFRTMYHDAAVRQAEVEQLNEADGPLFKIRSDPRVTPAGRVLRRFSLDEMPNVLNVLRGEMSLVGPRPLPLRDYRLLEDWHRKRYLVLPGITGLWQISGRSELGFDDLVRLDFYYLENWSIWLDVSILIKTVPAVLGRRGAF